MPPYSEAKYEVFYEDCLDFSHGLDTVQPCRSIRMFRTNILPPSSGLTLLDE